MGGHWPGPWGTGSDLMGLFNKQTDQRQPTGDRHCCREALRASTGETNVHFLWNASGIPGKRPTTTTSLATRALPLTGSSMGSSAGRLFTPAAKTTVRYKGFYFSAERADQL